MSLTKRQIVSLLKNFLVHAYDPTREVHVEFRACDGKSGEDYIFKIQLDIF